jgi:hypothetical protein
MTKKVFDIVPPGKAMASPNSRSVIVSDKPAVKDEQMVTPHNSTRLAKSADGDKRPLMRSAEKVHLQPVSVPSEESEDDASAPTKLAPATETAPSLNPEIVAAAADVPLLPEETRTEEAVPDVPDIHLDIEELAALSEISEKPASGRTSVSTQPSGPPLLIDEPMPGEPAEPAEPETPAARDEKPAEETGPIWIEESQPASDEAEAPAPASDEPAATEEAKDPEPVPAEAPAASTPSTEASTPPSQEAEGPVVKDTFRREDLLSGAGMVMPEDAPQRMVVSHHDSNGLHAWQWILIAALVIIIALIAVNFLIDAELIKTDLNLPTTNLL